MPRDGFEAIGDGRYYRTVETAECKAFWYEQEIGTWAHLPVVILQRQGNTTVIEYAAGDFLSAQDAGFERLERGIYRRTVPNIELQDVAVQRIDLS